MPDNRTPDGRGFALRAVDGNAIEIILNDGRVESRWSSDPGSIQTGGMHHITAIVDGGLKIITWGRYNPYLRSVNGAQQLRIDEEVIRVRIYNRYLRTSEAITEFRFGPPAQDRNDALCFVSPLSSHARCRACLSTSFNKYADVL